MSNETDDTFTTMILVVLCDSVTGPLHLDTHLRLVRELTWPVRADWYSLGEQLGVTDETRKVKIKGLVLLNTCEY